MAYLPSSRSRFFSEFFLLLFIRHDCFGDLVPCIYLLCVSGLVFQQRVLLFDLSRALLFQALLAYVVILVRSKLCYKLYFDSRKLIKTQLKVSHTNLM